MQRGRAYRRHQARRHKQRAWRVMRQWYYGLPGRPDAIDIGRGEAVHCVFCSSPWCCGNARPVAGPTKREIEAALRHREEAAMVGEPGPARTRWSEQR